MQWAENRIIRHQPILRTSRMHLISRAARLRPAFRRDPTCLRNRFYTITAARCASDRSVWQRNPPQRSGASSRKPWTRSVPKHSSLSEPPPRSHSLFRDLFPDFDTTDPAGEDDQGPDGAAAAAASSRRGEPWREISISTNDLRSWLEAQAGTDDVLPDKDHMPAMLVLTNASRSLAESDFHRIGPQGAHLQGWNGPIKRIIQAYDRNTLEPLGCFFILFASKAAARAYQTQAERMHWPLRPLEAICLRSHMPPGKSSASSPSAFTLSSSSTAPLGLKLHSLPPSTDARLKAFTIDGILATATLHTSADSEQIIAFKPEADHRVILSLDGGAINLSTLQGFLQRDGEHRNLPWDITGVYPYLPRKLSAAKPHPENQRGSRRPDNTKTTKKKKVIESEVTGQAAKGSDFVLDSAKSGRFILSFGDVHEARRFVRMWHRRHFELPPSLDEVKDMSGRHPQRITMNVMIPW